MIMGPCKAEITQPSIHLAIKQDIACFDVSVDDNLLTLLMEVEDTRCDTFEDVEPFRPTQTGAAMTFSVQVKVKASMGI
jgi:hypothetical protein